MPYLQRQPLTTLLRSLLVFRLCRVPLIVKNARPLLAGLQRLPLLGPPLAHALIRRTFCAQFVGGESEAELAPLVAALAREGVGSILDYAAGVGITLVVFTLGCVQGRQGRAPPWLSLSLSRHEPPRFHTPTLSQLSSDTYLGLSDRQ